MSLWAYLSQISHKDVVGRRWIGPIILASGARGAKLFRGVMSGGKMQTTSRRWSVPGEPLTSFQINQIAFAARDGVANPEDAKRLMAHFCDLVERRKPLPSRLTEHFREAFTDYLDGAKSLEVAFGVKRKKGRPPADANLRIEMAAEVMRHRLAGKSHEKALIHSAVKFGYTETIVSEAWHANRMAALDLVIRERDNHDHQFTDIQKNILRRILHDMSQLNYLGKIAD
jgi:hypothetical protein